ncbi:MAG: carboxypeptidase regulatory-like domain-containing protein [Gemmatimonadales bacterium]|nr:carboxypeptidase regulatory-like domain-containing protein [Gemmatimonadales bacterium]
MSSVSPANGPLAGGTSVTITGTNFVNVTGVTVGGGALQGLSVVSSTQLTGQTPAGGSSGPQDVVVSSSSRGSGTCTGCFTYNAAMTISQVSPSNGPLSGGTFVTVTGTNFPSTVDSVQVDGAKLTGVSRVSSIQLTGTTPASSTGGARDVTVYASASGSATCAGCFTYSGNLGFLGGLVIDGVSGAGLQNATVGFLQGTTVVASTSTMSTGAYTSPSLEVGTYDVVASATGYVSATVLGAQVQANQTVTLENIPLVQSSSVPGAISGVVRDATNNQPINGATVELRAGINATTGTPTATTTTSSTGGYRFTSIAAGTYTVRTTATGYTDGVRTGTVVGNGEITGQDVIMSPIATGQVRIVLTWGSTPSDLDAHLTGPTESGTRFHVYYADRGSLTLSPYASLDVDQTSSFGPETITIAQQLSGVYRYSVHDYSNSASTSSTALALSGARVDLYVGGTRLQQFFVPNQPGTLWTVLELNGSTIAAINTMTYQSDPGIIPAPPVGTIAARALMPVPAAKPTDRH